MGEPESLFLNIKPSHCEFLEYYIQIILVEAHASTRQTGTDGGNYKHNWSYYYSYKGVIHIIDEVYGVQ
jgi:hypothetical protein